MRLIPLLLLLSINVTAQVAPERYWVRFTDKQSTPYSVNAPEQFLSARSIERRQRQGIPIDLTDLPVDPQYVAQVVATGAEVLCVSRWMNSVVVRASSPAVLDAIEALPFVLDRRPVGRATPDHDKWDKEFLLESKSNAEMQADEVYGLAFNQIDMMNGLNLHDRGFRGEGMLIAVLDAGFNATDNLQVFDSLRADGRILATFDAVGRTPSIYGFHSHGTAVLSTMAANWPGTMVGTAPKASYLLIRTEDVSSEFPIEEHFWISGAEFADSCGADILNTSLGYNTFDEPAYDHTYADMNGRTTPCAIASTMAARKGMLVVTSAGNQGNNPWQFITTPADADSILTIGAVDPFREPASFSSRGPSADGRVKPNVCAQGQEAIIGRQQGDVGPSNGTSFSGPILAGMAACLWQSVPDATNMEVLRAIERSSHVYDAPTDKLGYGIPDFAMAKLLLEEINPTDPEEDEVLGVYPNPFITNLNGSYFSSIDQRLEFRLVNMAGQVMARMDVDACAMCAQDFSITGLDHVAPGIYFLQVLGSKGKQTYKVAKAVR